MTEEEAQERLESPKNILNLVPRKKGNNHLNILGAGRRNGDYNLNPFVRALLGAAAHLDTAKSVAREFNVSREHVANLKHGIIDRPSGVREDLAEAIEQIKKPIHETAADLVAKTLGLITDDKLEAVDKVKDLTAIAKDLSHVVEKTSPRSESGTKVNVVIYKPEPMKSADFGEVIEVEAREIK